jgi:hypothetical protein
MIFNLYIGNHGKQDGIEDYVRVISDVLAARGLRIQVSPTLVPGAVNLVIDEFTNYRENGRIAAFKKEHPESRLVYVLTEFVERKLGVESLNLFGGLFDVAVVAVFNVYLPLIRKDFPRPSIAACLKALLFAPLLVVRAIPDTARFVAGRLLGRHTLDPVRRFLLRNHRIIYFHLRYLGLMASLRWADAVFTSHEKIIETFQGFPGTNGAPLKDLGVLYPELDVADILSNLLVGKELFIEMTGSITEYRRKQVSRINRAIVSLGMHQVFGRCRVFPFATLQSKVRKERGAYSLHPPQTRTWAYCSPTRIFRALSAEYSLPVLTRHHGQHPIEDACFVMKNKYSIVNLYEMYHDRMLLIDFVANRLKTYNELARLRNDEFVRRLRSLVEDGRADVQPAAVPGKEGTDGRAPADPAYRKLASVK